MRVGYQSHPLVTLNLRLLSEHYVEWDFELCSKVNALTHFPKFDNIECSLMSKPV